MNDNDRQNIDFIRSRTPEELQQWIDALKDFGDDAEIEYAFEMLFAARNQIEIELLELFDEDVQEDVTEAAEYLKRFRLQ